MDLARCHTRKSERLWCPGNIATRRFALRDVSMFLPACGRMVINNRVLLVDPVTGMVVAEVAD